MATTVAPASIAELSDAMRSTESDGATVTVRGAGTKDGWGGLARASQVVVETTALAGIVEHEPGDLVLTAHAGTRIDDVQEAVAAHGQRLALDPPEPGATIGGIVATAASGPLRFRYGPPRDQLIGITVVLADGTVAKSGGKVVKNVAGYDLGKLFTGSFGTLGVIATVTFKLQPIPAGRRVVSVPATEPGAVWRVVARSTAAPAAVEWDGSQVHVLLEASTGAVGAIAERLAKALAGATVTDELPAGFGARPWRSGGVGLKVTHRLSALDEVVGAVRRELPGAALAAHVGSGVLWAGCDVDDEPVLAELLQRLRTAVSAYDGGVVVADAPARLKNGLDVWGPVPAPDLMHRVKDRFDPAHRLNPGRFVDGI